MIRSALATVVAVAVLQSAAAAQSFTGNWTVTMPNGAALALQLTQARLQVTGALQGNGTTFQVQGQVRQGRMTGYARNPNGALYLAAQLANGALVVTLSEVGANNQPVVGTSQQVTMTRADASASAGGATMAPPPTLGPGVVGPQPGRGSGVRGGAAADPYVGTFVAENLSITLRRNGQYYVGSAQSAGGQYPVQAQLVGGILNGVYVDNGQQRAFQAQVQGDVLQLAADGTTFMMQRQGGGMAQRQMGQGGMGQPGAGMGQPGGAAGQSGGAPGGVSGSGPQDRQISQLLLSSRWCYFSYSQTSGTTHTEHVQFFPNGSVVQSSGAESYNSGVNGTVAGQSAGGDRGMWRVQNGMLMLSADGANWTPQPIQVTRNSSGYPIVTSGGKEYSQCN